MRWSHVALVIFAAKPERLDVLDNPLIPAPCINLEMTDAAGSVRVVEEANALEAGKWFALSHAATCSPS
jgi:nitrate reductase NapAB chaperone NapD